MYTKMAENRLFLGHFLQSFRCCSATYWVKKMVNRVLKQHIAATPHRGACGAAMRRFTRRCRPVQKAK
jgi:hypothetical protein